MEPIRTLRARFVLLPIDDADTDQIIPARFLKTTSRSGLGAHLFADRRGPDFPLDRPEARGASVLVAGRNFGCGSSREHAPWALEDYGFRAIIAPSFADIFYSNCTKIGLLPVVLPEEEVRAVMAEGEAAIDLEVQEVEFAGRVARFEIDSGIKYRLMNGLDDIGQSLERIDDVARFERERERTGPVTTNL